MDTLRHRLEECGAQFTRALHEPDGRQLRADDPGIVEIGSGFSECVALPFIEVSEKDLPARPHDRALTGSTEGPGSDTRRLRTCHGCQDAEHHHVPCLVCSRTGMWTSQNSAVVIRLLCFKCR